MALIIEHEEIERLVAELMHMTGRTAEEVILDALRHAHDAVVVRGMPWEKFVAGRSHAPES